MENILDRLTNCILETMLDNTEPRSLLFEKDFHLQVPYDWQPYCMLEGMVLTVKKKSPNLAGQHYTDLSLFSVSNSINPFMTTVFIVKELCIVGCAF
jgi:hypothetical protein